MADEWVVVLEVARSAGARPVEPERLRRLLVAMTEHRPATLVGPDRIAVQLHVVADGPAEALLVALARWRDVSGRLAVPPWELARAEVMSRAELEADCVLADTASVGSHARDEGDDLIEVAFRDPLTRLATQGLFMDCFERALVARPAVGRLHAVMLVALDDLTGIRARHGAAAADRVMVAAAKQLVRSLRTRDTVGRLHNDHFAVLIKHTSSAAAETVAPRIADRVQVSLLHAGTEVGSRATVGLATGHADQGSADLLREAAAALVIARARGSRWAMFTASSLVPGVADGNVDAVLARGSDAVPSSGPQSHLRRPEGPTCRRPR